MQFYKVIISPEAEKDINYIIDYIALDNHHRAIVFGEKLQQNIINCLSVFPEKYREYKTCRILVHGSYLILFEVQKIETTVNVFTIVNSKQYDKYKNRLFKDV